MIASTTIIAVTMDVPTCEPEKTNDGFNHG